MKKTLPMFLVFAIALSITACAEKDVKNVSGPTSDMTSTIQVSMSEEETQDKKADLDIRASNQAIKTIYDEAVRKTSELNSMDVKSIISTKMSGSETSDTKINLNIKISDMNKENMRYFGVGTNSAMGEVVDVVRYFEHGFYYDNYANQKIKYAMEPAEMMKQIKQSMEGAGLNSSNMKEIMVKKAGDNQVFTFEMDVQKMDTYVDDLMSKMEADLDGVTYIVKEAYGEAIVNNEGYFTDTKFHLSLEMTTRGNTSTLIKDIETSYHNPGQDVEVTVPNLEGYMELDL